MPLAKAQQKMRWEVYYVLAVMVALALIMGAGAAIAAYKARPALDGSMNAMVPQAQAASLENQTSTAPTAETTSGTPDGPADLQARDAQFAVDPNNTQWSFDDNGRKTVYLTIDDGPSENTPAVLDILDRYGCKATFFVVGHNPDSYHWIAEAYRRGHTIGMHTFSHDYADVYASVDNYFADLDAICNVVRDQIGYVPCFIRFPGGSSNDVSIEYCEGLMTQLTAEVQARGFQYWDWNLSVGDGAEHSAEEIASYGTEPLDEGNNENIVLLCHDSATKAATVEALPTIIEHYQAQGYVFEALDRSSWVCHHDVQN